MDRRTGKARPRSTREMRTALKGMLDLAVRHEAISANPMGTVANRQDFTKTRDDRTLFLPDHVAGMLLERREHTRWSRPHDPVFASRTGNWLNPSNIRTRLQNATLGLTELGAREGKGLSPHDLRRTVGTLIAHEDGLDAAREQLGHSDGSTTYQHYVGKRETAPDLRLTLDQFFIPLPCVGAP